MSEPTESLLTSAAKGMSSFTAEQYKTTVTYLYKVSTKSKGTVFGYLKEIRLYGDTPTVRVLT